MTEIIYNILSFILIAFISYLFILLAKNSIETSNKEESKKKRAKRKIQASTSLGGLLHGLIEKNETKKKESCLELAEYMRNEMLMDSLTIDNTISKAFSQTSASREDMIDSQLHFLKTRYDYKTTLGFIEELYKMASKEKGITEKGWSRLAYISSILDQYDINELMAKYAKNRILFGYKEEENEERQEIEVDNPLKKYYQILGLDTSATKEDIRRQYKKLALIYHPDMTGDKEQSAANAEIFKKISNAYQNLCQTN